MRPQGVALPVLGCAVWVQLRDTIIEEVRVCIAPVAPTPVRLEQTEAALHGADVSDDAALAATLDRACALVHHEIDPRTSKYRATAEYRLDMADVLLRGALAKAVERARTGEAVPEGVGA
jgi:carbon-monoxide dehydrogenase medium subunit